MPLLESFLAAYCSATTIIRFTIPGKAIYSIYQTKETEKFPYFVLINTMLSSVFWLYYWVHNIHPFFMFNNIYGLFLNGFYLIVFIHCIDNSNNTRNSNSFRNNSTISEDTKKKLYLCTILTPILLFILLLILKIKADYIAFMATIFNTLMLASTLQKIIKCFEEKDSDYLPIYIIYLNTVSSIGYVFYATIYYNWNVFLMFPHTISLLLGIFQIYVYYYFKYYYSKSEDKNISNDRLNDIKDIDVEDNYYSTSNRTSIIKSIRNSYYSYMTCINNISSKKNKNFSTNNNDLRASLNDDFYIYNSKLSNDNDNINTEINYLDVTNNMSISKTINKDFLLNDIKNFKEESIIDIVKVGIRNSTHSINNSSIKIKS